MKGLLRTDQTRGEEEGGQQGESHNGLQRLSKAWLRAQLLASEAEIAAAASALQLVEDEDAYLLLPRECFLDAAQQALQAIASQRLSTQLLRIDELHSSVGSELGPEVLKYVLCALGSSLTGEAGAYRLELGRVCRLGAELVLTAGKEMQTDQLFLEWCALVPAECLALYPTASQLQLFALREGLAVCTAADRLTFLPAQSLPESLPELLRRLYAVKARYTATELAPYVTAYWGREGQAKSVLDLLLSLPILHLDSASNDFLLKP